MDSYWEILRAVVVIVIAYMVVFVAALVNILFERRVLAFMQDRLGPNRTGPQGVLQSVADAFKMMGKEDFRPALADPVLFTLAPIMVMIGAVTVQLVMPYTKGFTPRDLNVGLIYIVAVTSFTTIAILLGGWSSRNKYSLVGALRSAAQMISYEIPMLLALVVVAMLRRFAQSRHRRRPAERLPLARLLRAVHLHDLRDRHHRRAQPRPVRPARVRVRARGGLRHRVLGHALRHVLPQRVRRHDDHVDGRRRRSSSAAGTAPFEDLLDDRRHRPRAVRLVPPQDVRAGLRAGVGASLAAAPAGRPAHGLRLEDPHPGRAAQHRRRRPPSSSGSPHWRWGMAARQLGRPRRVRRPLRPDPAWQLRRAARSRAGGDP